MNHLSISIIKSAFRILGYGCLMEAYPGVSGIQGAGILLILAEIFGIVEELV